VRGKGSRTSTQVAEWSAFKGSAGPGVSGSGRLTPMAAAQTPAELGPETRRSIDLSQMGAHRWKATNRRGGVLPIGAGEDPDFIPVELLLAALAGCGAVDLDLITGKRAPFATFAARAEGHKVRDEQGSHLVQLSVTFDVTFPPGEGGDAAREVLPRTLQQIQDRLCTVGRTVAIGEPVAYVAGELDDPGPVLSPGVDPTGLAPVHPSDG
jgi:putative redox protein